MVEILRLVLTNFWPFCAAVVLIGCTGNAVAEVVTTFKKTTKEDN